MKRYVMIGSPVTTVRTPPLLEGFLAERGVEARVEVREVRPDGLAAFMAGAVADRTVDGLMVTMPHKRAIIPHLAAISRVAARAGSVNAAKRLPDGALVGAQFDGVALVNALTTAGVPLASVRILLAGAGGAGLAIAQAIVAHGCAGLAIAERDVALLERTVADLRDESGCPVAIFDEAADGAFDVLVNATPLGMQAGDPSPFAPDLVARARWVADIVADPPRTRLAASAAEVGLPVITGRDMVRGQIAPIGGWLLADGVEQ